ILARLDGTPMELFHNETPTTGNWLGIYLTGQKQRDPLGALVEVRAGDRVLKRQLLSQTSKGAQNERRLHFGIGAAALVDVTVTWPLGGTDRITGVPANSQISIEEGCTAKSQSWPGQCNQLIDPPPTPKLKHLGCS